jgi:hypothetical protein
MAASLGSEPSALRQWTRKQGRRQLRHRQRRTCIVRYPFQGISGPYQLGPATFTLFPTPHTMPLQSLPLEIVHEIRLNTHRYDHHPHAFFAFLRMDTFTENAYKKLCADFNLAIPNSISCTYRDLFLVCYVHSTRCHHYLCTFRPIIVSFDTTRIVATSYFLDHIKFHSYSGQNCWMTFVQVLSHITCASTLVQPSHITSFDLHLFHNRCVLPLHNPNGITFRDFSAAVLKAMNFGLTKEQILHLFDDYNEDGDVIAHAPTCSQTHSILGDVVDRLGVDVWWYSGRRRSGDRRWYLLVNWDQRSAFEVKCKELCLIHLLMEHNTKFLQMWTNLDRVVRSISQIQNNLQKGVGDCHLKD